MDDVTVGFTGVIVGALITGVFTYFQAKQSIDTAKLEKKKELLLMKYECMYKDLGKYYEYALEISLLTINSIDDNLDIKKLKANLNNNDFIMYSMFYTPELSVQINELTDKLGGVIKSLSELIIKGENNRNEKEKLIGSVVISSLELEDKIKNIQQQLAKMAKQLIST
ncbi:MAG: hypothetical protein D4R63_06135 [Methylococcaceae bacterium]|nr:MAG: hypothetical protein D4R63_06135 [Methylococcaceae bacterium]